MPLYEFSKKNAIQILATQSRRIDISSYELSQVHIELGRYLAYQIVDEIPLEDFEFNHPQGKRIGKRIENEKDIIILTFMRAGAYLADGIRSFFKNAYCYHVYPKRGVGLSEDQYNELEKMGLSNKIVILTDSVINTGESMKPVIKWLQKQSTKKIIVACSVMPTDTAKSMESEFYDVDIYTIRVSDNKYVGKGTTDTGNRLFGTF